MSHDNVADCFSSVEDAVEVDKQFSSSSRPATSLALEHLSPEILFAIITQVPDLPSLHHFICASPAAYRLFDRYAVNITEAVLTNAPIAPQIAEIVRVIVAIRSSALPVLNFDDFMRRHVHECMKHRGSRSKDAYIPTSLSNTTPPIVLRGILATAMRKACLALACLEDCRSQAISIKPERLADSELERGFSYERGYRGSDPDYYDYDYPKNDIRHYGMLPPWKKRPQGQSYAPVDTGPPTWIEEQRATRAFWRIQLFYDLRHAARVSRLDWTIGDLERLNGMDPVSFYDDPERPGLHPGRSEIYELITAYWYAQEYQSVDHGEILFNRGPYRMSPRDEVLEVMKHVWNSKMFQMKLPSTDKKLPFNWRNYMNPGQSRGSMCFSGLESSEYSPLKGISFDHFRRLGIAFWQPERMVGLGLLHSNGASWNGAYVSEFTWRSIVDPKVLDELDRMLDERASRERRERLEARNT